MKNKVKFADHNTLTGEWVGCVSIKRKNDEYSLISYMLYILGIMCNILSISQFLKRNYKIHMENKVLKLWMQIGV